MTDITHNRHGGNAASNEAFQRSQGRHANARAVIYKLFEDAPNGLTSKEVAAKLNWALNTLSGRLTELERDGKIRGTGERRLGAEVHEVVRVAEQVSLWEAA